MIEAEAERAGLPSPRLKRAEEKLGTLLLSVQLRHKPLRARLHLQVGLVLGCTLYVSARALGGRPVYEAHKAKPTFPLATV